MKRSNFILLLALLPTSVLAGTVVYTDSRHLPENLPLATTIVLLDEPYRLQKKMFGQLSADPQHATTQIMQVMSSPKWQQNQQLLVTTYQRIMHAWKLGIRKVPAVVFDDRDVIYGTTDVAQAVALRQQVGGNQ